MYRLPKSPAVRITPACAGNRRSAQSMRRTLRDHPRLRGEQISSAVMSRIMPGSPPLARGTGYRSTALCNLPRITPACAGNSLTKCSQICVEKDHPRLRGEQYTDDDSETLEKGSPPLARGTVVTAHPRVSLAGITPACAGNRKFCTSIFQPVKDHPRLRGEQGILAFFKRAFLGSPPLARGTGG